MPAKVVQIRQEGYDFGRNDDPESNFVNLHNTVESETEVNKPSLSISHNIEKNKFGTKLLRDINSNGVGV